MLRVTAKWLIVALLAFLVSAPWAAIQSAAWAGMIVKFSRDYGLQQAVSMTFDGKHPCPLCHLVKKGMAKEREDGKKTFSPEETLQLGLAPDLWIWVHPPHRLERFAAAEPFDSLVARPPTPPPRPC